MYKNYIFDLYGTLVDINTDEDDENLWEKMSLLYGYKGANYTPNELKKEYLSLVKLEKATVKKRHSEYDFIDIKIEKVFKKLFTKKGIKITSLQVSFIAEAFRCFSTKYIKLYDGVIDLLELLKKNNKKIYLLSNAQTYFTMNELNMLGLTPYFDGICISSDEEVSKPDIHYFNTLFNRFSLNKEESIMIGNDYISDIEGASNFGIDSLYIHQSISPDIKGELKSNYSIMDGNVYKIKNLIVKQ